MPLLCGSLSVPFNVLGLDLCKWNGHCFSLTAWFPGRLHVTKWRTASLLFLFHVCVHTYVPTFVCVYSEHMCISMWCSLKLMGEKKLKVPEPNFKLRFSLQRLECSVELLKYAFSTYYCFLTWFFSENLGEKLKTTSAGNFQGILKFRPFESVMGLQIALSASNIHTVFVLLVIHEIV